MVFNRTLLAFCTCLALVIGGAEVGVRPGWAKRQGRSELIGRIIGTAGGQLTAVPTRVENAPVSESPRGVAPRGGILDLQISALYGLSQIDHVGDYPDGMVGMSFATTSCNVGTVNVDWFAPMNVNHPIICQNLYRIYEDRLEQIGLAWAKHGFLAMNNSGCGDCQPSGTGTRLGPGCQDTYAVYNNADRHWMGPRSEVNPFTGVWDCVGSHFSGGEPDCVRRHTGSEHGPMEHLIEVQEADLGIPGADYYIEGYYITAGDENVYNNVAWRRVTTSWDGFRWTSSSDWPRIEGPMINAWSDEHATFSAGEGDVIMAVMTTEITVGNFHYEYALYNHNLDREIRSVSIPIDPTAVVTNIGFRDVDDDPTNDWTAGVADGFITWQTDDYETDPQANTLKYGTLYNFSFDADKVPVDSLLTVGLFKPGTGSLMTAQITGPQTGMLDCNSNGVEDIQDIIGGTSLDCNHNSQPDECDIDEGRSPDCNADDVPDDCQLVDNDCNNNTVPDDCDVVGGTSLDCQPNGIPDECEGAYNDCNSNAIPDDCEITQGTSQDCQPNGLPDDCDLYVAPFEDDRVIAVAPPLDIPADGGDQGVEHTYFLGEHGTITDLDVDVVITHTWNGDLVVTISHNDVSVTIIDRPGYPQGQYGYADDGFDVILDDEASEPIETHSGGGDRVTGTFRPNEPLSVFDGMDKYGQWTIWVGDFYAAADQGTLDEWSLHVDDAGRPGEGDCNENGVPDGCEPDSDGDNIIDDCVVTCVCGDYDANGEVNLNDFMFVAACFGLTAPSEYCPAEFLLCVDLNRDGEVNLSDFVTFAFLFGGSSSGSPPDCMP